MDKARETFKGFLNVTSTIIGSAKMTQTELINMEPQCRCMGYFLAGEIKFD